MSNANYLRKFNPWTKTLQWVVDASLMKIRGSVDTYNDLPLTGNAENDCYITRDTDRLYTWGISASSGTLDDWKDVGSTAQVDWSAITNKPSSSVSNIDDAVDKRHTQGSDTSLGALTSNINMNSHKLTSLSVPSSNGDSIRATTKITEVHLEDSVDKKHEHINKIQLDLVTDGDHDIRTDNPHSVDKTDVGLNNVTNNAQVKKASSSTDDYLPKWKGTSGDELEDSSISESDASDAVSKKHTQNTDNTIIIDSSPDSDTTAEGIKTTFTAGENLSFGDVCYIKSDGKLWKADADAESTSFTIAIALATISADVSGSFLLIGIVRCDSWNWTVGSPIYLSTTLGGITQTIPSGSGDIVQILGIATHANRIYFNPSLSQAEIN